MSEARARPADPAAGPADPTVCPTGPRGRLGFGSMLEYTKDPLGFLTSCARIYGDVVRTRFYHFPFLFFNHPDAVQEVLVVRNKSLRESYVYRHMLTDFLGDSLFRGEFHLQMRRAAYPALHALRVNAFVQVMVADAQRILATWTVGETRDLLDEMHRLTFDLSTGVLFGGDLGQDPVRVVNAFEVIMRCLQERIASPIDLPMRIPTRSHLRWRRAVKRLDEVIYALIRARRACGTDSGDLLSMLMTSEAADGSPPTDRQLRDEIALVFLAGHEATSLVLAWAFTLLAHHPPADAALEAELRAVLDGRAPTADDLPNLRYTRQVVKEAMRLYPPVWALCREAREDFTVGGCPVPRGTQVLVSQWVVHRDARWYPQPERFMPERWTDAMEQALPRWAYFPFGGGARECIGRGFAMTELVLLLALVAQRFRMVVADDRPLEILPSITLRPRHRIRVTLAAR
jgi:cytochrome P450